MKEFNSKYKSEPLGSYIIVIVIAVFIVFILSLSPIFNVWFNIIFLIGIGIYLVADYFIGTYIRVIKFDNQNNLLSIIFSGKNGKEREIITMPYDKINFIYEYENISKSMAVPILKIYSDKKIIAKLMEGTWEKSIIDNIIEEFKSCGIKGKVTRTKYSNTNDFEYIN